MEPQDNKQISLRKAISAHEQAEAAVGDLMAGFPHESYPEMLERLKMNREALLAQENAEAADAT